METPDTCPHCEAPTTDSDRFCRSCGTSLSPGGFCHSCGTEARLGDERCRSCGEELVPAEEVGALRYRITPARIIVMSLLSGGLFLLWWLYVTWEQYRDLTEDRAFPLWHTLSFAVPIYGYYRGHAHVRVFKELMVERGVETTLNPAAAVLALVVLTVLGLNTFRASDLGAIIVLSLVSIAVSAGLMLLVQENLNRLWDDEISVDEEPIGTTTGQVIFAVIGVLSWTPLLAGV